MRRETESTLIKNQVGPQKSLFVTRAPSAVTRRSTTRLAVVGALAWLALVIPGVFLRTLSYRVVKAPANQVGAPAEWIIAREGADGQRWIARDTDGDGTWDEFDSPLGAFARPALSSSRRWLVICLDGVPVTAMQSLWDAGQFREFFRPTATVSTFPSDSEMALTTALHAGPVPGYEHRYFDRASNAMRGGAWVTMSGYRIPYIQKLDYDPPGWSKAAPYVMLRKTYDADLGRFRATFLGSRDPVFLAHITASDAFLHMRTVRQARSLLLEFDDVLRELYLDARGDLGIIVFSDHGNTQLPNRAVPLEAFLTEHGWRVSDSLHTTRDVAIPPYGLVGFAAIYCQPESVDQLAEDLRGIEGADLIREQQSYGASIATIREAGSSATRRVGMVCWMAGATDTAHEKETRLIWRSVFDRLRAYVQTGRERLRLRRRSVRSHLVRLNYPDVASPPLGTRSAQTFDIMVSFRPGYFWCRIFSALADLAGTMVVAWSSASLGFAMATFPLPAAVRVSDVIPGRLLESASARKRPKGSTQAAAVLSSSK